MVFTVTLSNPSSQSISVNPCDGECDRCQLATAGSDYTAVSGLLTFAPEAKPENGHRADDDRCCGTSRTSASHSILGATTRPSPTIRVSGMILERIQLAVGDTGYRVRAPALASGTQAASTAEIITGNLLTNDFTPAGLSMTIDRVTFGGTNYTPTGNVVTVDTPLGLPGLYGSRHLWWRGPPGRRLCSHPADEFDGRRQITEQFTHRINDGSGGSSTANPTVRIVDDAPVGADIQKSLVAAPTTLTYNLTIILDVGQHGKGCRWAFAARAGAGKRSRR